MQKLKMWAILENNNGKDKIKVGIKLRDNDKNRFFFLSEDLKTFEEIRYLEYETYTYEILNREINLDEFLKEYVDFFKLLDTYKKFATFLSECAEILEEK